MKRKLVYIPVILIITGLILTFSIITNNSIILTKIYYQVSYNSSIQNSETLIEKSEIFEYEKHVKYRDYPGETHNLSRSNYPPYIDREYIESLMLKIEADKRKFHLFPAYRHNFIYSVEVNNESLIYLTYNNNTIIKVESENNTEIFSAGLAFWDPNSPHWTGTWYLNFTQIPFALNESSAITLNDIILVKMKLKYNQVFSFWSDSYLTIEQCLFFKSDFQIMFVTIDVANIVQ